MNPKAEVLTQLKLKHWRSIREATIDFAPITVFIGANSSGKSNILEALHFMRDLLQERDLQRALFRLGGVEQVRTLGIEDKSFQIVASYPLEDDHGLLKDMMSITWDYPDLPGFSRTVEQGDTVLSPQSNSVRLEALLMWLNEIKRERWQLLREDLLPPLSVSAEADPGDPFLIESNGRNVSPMLNFMKQYHEQVFDRLQDDLSWLLEHVDRLESDRDKTDIRMSLREKSHPGVDAPTISTGTRRLIAMLTAYYALDMRDTHKPGLIVIEEPDTAIHPLLLRKFVEQLRNYTDPGLNGGHQRQFILTTHNPIFLNAFQPDEVRLVERDSQTGWTSIHQIDPDLAQVAFEQDGAYNLGNLWTTRLMGGVPEW